MIRWILALLIIQLVTIYELDRAYNRELLEHREELQLVQQRLNAISATVEGLEHSSKTNHRDIQGVVTFIQRKK